MQGQGGALWGFYWVRDNFRLGSRILEFLAGGCRAGRGVESNLNVLHLAGAEPRPRNQRNSKPNKPGWADSESATPKVSMQMA